MFPPACGKHSLSVMFWPVPRKAVSLPYRLGDVRYLKRRALSSDMTYGQWESSAAVAESDSVLHPHELLHRHQSMVQMEHDP